MLIFIKRNQSPPQTTTKGKGKHTNQDQTCSMWLTQRLVDPCSSLTLSQPLFETGSLHTVVSARLVHSLHSFLSFLLLHWQSKAKQKQNIVCLASILPPLSSLSCALLRSLCVCLMPLCKLLCTTTTTTTRIATSVVAHACRQRRQRQWRCFGALLSAPLSFAAREIRCLQFSSSASPLLFLCCCYFFHVPRGTACVCWSFASI